MIVLEPLLSVIIPTPGKGRPLARCLASIAPQVRTGDEVLVVGDTHGAPDGLPEVERCVKQFAKETGQRFVYVAHDAGYHGWGHPQINAGIELAQGDYLLFQDDDDVHTPGAFDVIRATAAALVEPRPLLFRFTSYAGITYWHTRGMLAQDHVGGHCIVAPNLPERLGRWSDRYAGDWDFIRSTLDKWPNGDDDAVWCDQVIAVARPGEWMR